jgi:phage-related minor tail protein
MDKAEVVFEKMATGLSLKFIAKAMGSRAKNLKNLGRKGSMSEYASKLERTSRQIEDSKKGIMNINKARGQNLSKQERSIVNKMKQDPKGAEALVGQVRKLNSQMKALDFLNRNSVKMNTKAKPRRSRFGNLTNVPRINY